MPSIEGLAARRAALQMLDQVLRRGRTLEAALQAARDLSQPDRALALAIAGEVLRRIPDLDALIDSATKRALPHDSKARAVLRIALAQKIGLDTPDHALVATALPLVDGGPRRLVHGVLGTLLRRGISVPDAPRLPAAVENRWTTAWGPDVVASARRMIALRPPLDLSFASDADARDFAHPQGTSLAPRHVRLRDAGAVTELPGYEAGRWWVQDLAASVPARLIPSDRGQVLDLCAAPGGKTMQLASAGQQVTALDVSESRLARLGENLARTGLDARLVAADAMKWRADRAFDAVLVDAPCSATGTFRRHPEILYRASPRIIAESADFQRQLIRKAAALVRPGGVLVYSVCSLEPEEGEKVISDFLAGNRQFRVRAPGEEELPGFMTPDDSGCVRLLPGMLEGEGGLDGFFAARLVRSPE